jgi:hypothetical protein
MTPAENLPLVSMILAANFATSSAGVVDTGGEFATGVHDTRGKFATVANIGNNIRLLITGSELEGKKLSIC